jgi:hypothetical protein
LASNNRAGGVFCIYRVQTIQEIAENIRSDWEPPMPASLHWDGKLMETLSHKYKRDDRLPTLLRQRRCQAAAVEVR